MSARSFLRSQLSERKKYNSFLVGNQEQSLFLEYLVIAGGGGGGQSNVSNNYGGGGGGGAGGYRSSVIGESSGGGASAESVFTFDLGTDFTVTVGAGGGEQANGSNSVFASITSIGGGRGSGTANSTSGGSGGGGAGRSNSRTLGSGGTANQGFAGADGYNEPIEYSRGGGGGGAGSIAPDSDIDRSIVLTPGGDGLASNINGTLVTRAKGGDGVKGEPSSTPKGGANGDNNTGSGGGGSEYRTGGSGGSGVVILRYPASFTITIAAGLTATTSTVGAKKVTEVTAGTGNVSFN